MTRRLGTSPLAGLFKAACLNHRVKLTLIRRRWNHGYSGNYLQSFQISLTDPHRPPCHTPRHGPDQDDHRRSRGPVASAGRHGAGGTGAADAGENGSGAGGAAALISPRPCVGVFIVKGDYLGPGSAMKRPSRLTWEGLRCNRRRF
jgi:hypothetical protein